MKKTGGSCLAEYRRFVAYVYEYQKEKKGSNCGFVKIEVRGEICRIEVSGTDAGVHMQCLWICTEQGAVGRNSSWRLCNGRR